MPQRDGLLRACAPDIMNANECPGVTPGPAVSRPALPRGRGVGGRPVGCGVGLLPPGSDGACLTPAARPSCACVGLRRTHPGRGCEGESERGDHLQPPWRTGTALSLPPRCVDVAHRLGSSASEPDPPCRQSCMSEKVPATSSSTPAPQTSSGWPTRRPGAVLW